jgi:hypothetical protein
VGSLVLAGGAPGGLRLAAGPGGGGESGGHVPILKGLKAVIRALRSRVLSVAADTLVLA